MKRFEPGDHIVMRDASDGLVRAATPVTVIEDSPARLVYFLTEGTRFFMRSAGRRMSGYDPDAAPFEEHTWAGPGSLTVKPKGLGFAVKAFWRGANREFSGWYINLETELSRTAIGFDRRDQVLDVLIAPDGVTWQWKDEDEFADAILAGRISEKEAESVRSAGLRAVEMARTSSPPFSEGWETWAPPDGAEIPNLPPGWDLA